MTTNYSSYMVASYMPYEIFDFSWYLTKVYSVIIAVPLYLVIFSTLRWILEVCKFWIPFFINSGIILKFLIFIPLWVIFGELW